MAVEENAGQDFGANFRATPRGYALMASTKNRGRGFQPAKSGLFPLLPTRPARAAASRCRVRRTPSCRAWRVRPAEVVARVQHGERAVGLNGDFDPVRGRVAA